MQADKDKLIHYIKAQVESFLKEMDDFYPFGAAISSTEELKPIGAYLDAQEVSVSNLINMLEGILLTP